MTMRVHRSHKLDIRLTPEAKEAICAAAALKRLSVSAFVLDSALARAEETLIDQRIFSLDETQWQAFQESLDAPPRDLPRLRQLFRQTSPFESDDI
ncbi:MAG: DUF1778 domain-containing protein [Magnetococcales bacterium]|nr:DUF1778 domain-containing protein [Magnetococcales bacterium]